MANRKPKNLTWNVPFFGRGTIFFGVAAEDLAARSKQYTAFIKFLNGEAKISPAEVFSAPVEDSSSGGESLSQKAKHLGLQPKDSGREIKIFTFGLFVSKIDSRVRAGFMKRQQILVEA